MQNYKLKISYDGTRYFGWEHQPDKDTIQGKLETVLARMCDVPVEEIRLIGAGRTDAGVHAKEMTASVELSAAMSPDEIRDYMNRYLPDDIAVLEVKVASPRFHARYNAGSKTYRYTCYDGPVKPVFDRRYYTALDAPLDVDAMQKAADFLIGTHDFKSFCGNTRMKKSTVRTIDVLTVRRKKGYVTITIHGDGFLQNMVRIITGTLFEVGYGRLAPEDMTRILEAKDRRAAGPTAPAKGLCLLKVEYSEGVRAPASDDAGDDL